MMAIKYPICSSSAHYVFKSKHNKNIYVCESNLCGYFYTPVISLDQDVCERAANIERESNISMSIFEKRNCRLIQ